MARFYVEQKFETRGEFNSETKANEFAKELSQNGLGQVTVTDMQREWRWDVIDGHVDEGSGRYT